VFSIKARGRPQLNPHKAFRVKRQYSPGPGTMRRF
jgi:hypothetical protein